MKVRSEEKVRQKKEMKKMCRLFPSEKNIYSSACLLPCTFVNRVSYGVRAFPTYMANDFEMFTAAAGTELEKGDTVKKKKKKKID